MGAWMNCICKCQGMRATALWCCLHILLLGCCNGLNGQQPDAPKLQQFRAVWSRSGVVGTYNSAEEAAAASDRSSHVPSRFRLPAPSVIAIPQGIHAAVKAPGPLNRSGASRQLTAAAASAKMLPYPQEASAVQRYLSQTVSSGEAPYTIPTWFVVVVDPDNAWATNITTQQAQANVDLLNRAYATGLPDSANIILEAGSTAQSAKADHFTGSKRIQNSTTRTGKRRPLSSTSNDGSKLLWKFSLMGVRYTTSKAPMCIGSNAEQSTKSAWRSKLVQEGQTVEDRTLVIYVSDITSAACKGAVAGYSVMFGYGNTPFDLVFWKQHQLQFKDGIVIDPRYTFNSAVQKESGSEALHGASSGAQLVHEIGHWMGLMHTFDGGCQSGSPATDQVADTPAENHPTKWGVRMKDASSGCYSYRDSCGDIPGQDIVENYMTYNNLACAKSFTPGQQSRMLYLFKAVRKDR